MKKYIIFGFDEFYPVGGMNDISISVDSFEEVEEIIKQEEYNYYQIVDRDTWAIIREIL